MRVYNFGAGPAILPQPVLAEVQAELLDFQASGMSILEMSHRSKVYSALNAETETLFKELLELPADWRVLFLQGGASTQFAMVPMNFLDKDETADYVLTGSWAEKAASEAAAFGNVHIAGSSKESNYDRIPAELTFSAAPAYIHLTSNNTIYGTQWQTFPQVPAPLVADMSSDILSRRIDARRFALIYAGAQKNLGPAGVTVVIVSPELLARAGKGKELPTMLRYTTHAKADSLYNTPPVFAVYIVNKVLKWVQANGGLEAMEKQNTTKAKLIYDVIDNSGGFYRGHAQKASRSLMNITFNLATEDLEQAFIQAAAAAGLVGLKGHRSVGGIRASIYNAMPVAGCQALAEFMQEFQRQNG